MRIIKPQQLILLKGAYQLGEQSYLGLSVVAGFYLSDEQHFASEPEIWHAWQSAPLSLPILDAAEPKPFAEYLLAGHAGIGKAVTSLHASVNVAGIKRQWRLEGAAPASAVQVEPFVSMALDHRQSYGGARCVDNPLGQGYQDGRSPLLMDLGQTGSAQVHAPLAAPTPIPYDFAIRKRWLDQVAPEMADGQYLQTTFPGYPEALNPEYFQAAAPAQWYSQPAWPDKVPFELRGFRADNQVIQGMFPQVVAHAFGVDRQHPGTLQPIALQKKTLWLLPDADLGLMVFTGALPLSHLLAEPLSALMIALDGSQQPRDARHFSGVYAKRTAPDCADFEFLYDPDLMPQGMGMNVIDSAEDHPTSSAYRPGVKNNHRLYYQQIRQSIAEHQHRRDAEKNRDKPAPINWQALTRGRQANLPAILASCVENKIGGKVFIRQHIEKEHILGRHFKQCLFTDCVFSAVAFDHCCFDDCQFENCQWQQVEIAHSTLRHCAVTGGCVQQFVFNSSLFEAVKWHQTRFSAGNCLAMEWKDSVLDQVQIVDCQFTESKLIHTIFSAVSFHLWRCSATAINACTFDACQLEKTTFARSVLEKSSLLQGQWSGVAFTDCKLDCLTLSDHTDFSGTKIEHCLLNKVGLRGATLNQAELIYCSVTECNFDYASLRHAKIYACDMAMAKFNNSDLSQARVEKSSLQQGSFYQAKINDCQFIQCNLISCHFARVSGNSNSRFVSCLLEKSNWWPRNKVFSAIME